MKTQRRLHAALAQHRKLKSLAFKICAWETVRDTEVKQHLEQKINSQGSQSSLFWEVAQAELKCHHGYQLVLGWPRETRAHVDRVPLPSLGLSPHQLALGWNSRDSSATRGDFKDIKRRSDARLPNPPAPSGKSTSLTGLSPTSC